MATRSHGARAKRTEDRDWPIGTRRTANLQTTIADWEHLRRGRIGLVLTRSGATQRCRFLLPDPAMRLSSRSGGPNSRRRWRVTLSNLELPLSCQDQFQSRSLEDRQPVVELIRPRSRNTLGTIWLVERRKHRFRSIHSFPPVRRRGEMRAEQSERSRQRPTMRKGHRAPETS